MVWAGEENGGVGNKEKINVQGQNHEELDVNTHIVIDLPQNTPYILMYFEYEENPLGLIEKSEAFDFEKN